MKILILVPHPDDEILMMGGTITRLIQEKHTVKVFIFTAPIDDRTALQQHGSREAAKLLGHRVNFLNMSSERFNNIEELKTVTELVICGARPDVIYTVNGSDNHQDHQLLFRAVSIATRPIGATSVNKLIVGEIPSSTDQTCAAQQTFAPNIFTVLPDRAIQMKITAMKQFTKEYQPNCHPRSADAIKAQAIVRGAQVGHKYAEAFQLMRCIDK